MDGLLTTDKAVGNEKETIALMAAGRDRGGMPMRARAVDKALRGGPLTEGQKAAVKLILASRDRVVGVQGYAGSGKTTMLNRARALLEKRGFEVRGLAPSASAARTLESEAAIGSETLQRFLARYAGVAAGRMTAKGEKEMRGSFAKTVLVVDEGSLASTVQARDLLRIADALAHPARGARRRREAARRGRRRQALRPAPGRRHADRGDGPDHAPARPRAEGGGRGEPRRRHRPRLREARRECLRGETRQSRGRRRRALARALAGGSRAHRPDGAEPRAARTGQRDRPRAAHPRRRRSMVPRWKPSASPPGASPAPRRRSRGTTGRATWSGSTAPTSASASRRGTSSALPGSMPAPAR